jgi:hypothetical protein
MVIMVAAYVDQIVMFLAGVFAAWLGMNWDKLGLADKLPAPQRQGLATLLKIVGPLLMAVAVVLAALQAFGATSQP